MHDWVLCENMAKVLPPKAITTSLYLRVTPGTPTAP
jgi:hypothetical protein